MSAKLVTLVSFLLAIGLITSVLEPLNNNLFKKDFRLDNNKRNDVRHRDGPGRNNNRNSGSRSDSRDNDRRPGNAKDRRKDNDFDRRRDPKHRLGATKAE